MQEVDKQRETACIQIAQRDLQSDMVNLAGLGTRLAAGDSMQRIKFRLANNLSTLPPFLQCDLHRHHRCRPTMYIPRTRLAATGDGSFPVAATNVWNNWSPSIGSLIRHCTPSCEYSKQSCWRGRFCWLTIAIYSDTYNILRSSWGRSVMLTFFSSIFVLMVIDEIALIYTTSSMIDLSRKLDLS